MISSSSGTEKTGYRQIAAAVIVLLLAVAIAYSSLLSNGFINLDDNDYITRNLHLHKGFSLDSLSWAFGLLKSDITYWHPVTWLSLMLDYQLFGPSPVGYHLMNLVFHAANTMLLFLLMTRITGRAWQGLAVAALFALHPLQVEAVAWAVERKTVLSGFFFLLSVHAYLGYVQKPGPRRYAGALLLFLFGLMSKPVIIALPVVLLLMDFWPLKRWGTEKEGRCQKALPLVLEKVPFVAVALLVLTITILSLDSAMQSGAGAPWSNRIANALVSYVMYIAKMFLPTGLAAYYPLQHTYPLLHVAGASVFLLAVTGFSFLQAEKRPWLFAGWFWYIIMLLPASGLLRAGLWPAMADRFAYLPIIGLYIIITGAVTELAANGRLAKAVPWFTGAALLVLALLTWKQTGYWRDSLSLFGHTATVTKDNAIAYRQLGYAYMDEGNAEQALAMFRKVHEVDPEDPDYEWAMAQRLFSAGDLAGASAYVKKSLSKRENYARALVLSVKLNSAIGNVPKAVEECNRIIYSRDGDAAQYKAGALLALNSLMPSLAPRLDVLRQRVAANAADLPALGELALELDRLGFFEEALQLYGKLGERGMKGWQLDFNTGNVLKNLGRYGDAAAAYERCLRVNPRHADAWNNMGAVYRKLKDFDKAKIAFQRGMAADPSFSFAPFNLALTMLELNDKPNARHYFIYTRDRFPDLAERAASYLAKLER